MKYNNWVQIQREPITNSKHVGINSQINIIFPISDTAVSFWSTSISVYSIFVFIYLLAYYSAQISFVS